MPMDSDNENDPTQEAMDPPAEEASEDQAQPAQTENLVQPGVELPDNVVNLVPFLLEQAAQEGGEEIKKFITKTLPRQVVDHYDEDCEARKGWMEKRAERMKLFLGNIDPKHGAFKDAANLHVPILSTRILRLASRVYSEIFQQGQPIFAVQTNSRVTEEQANAITKAENWQFRKEIPEFQRHVFRAIIEFFLDGECTFDSYRDFDRNVNRHDYLSPDEFVYPYTRRTSSIDMSDVPRKTKVLFPYKRDIMKLVKLGFYDKGQAEKVCKTEGSHEDAPEMPNKDAQDKYEGMDPSEHTSDAPYCFLEYHGWTTIPGQEDEIPVRVVVDKKTETVLGLYSRYYDDPTDKVRFDKQTTEHSDFMGGVDQFTQAMQLEQQLLERLKDPSVPPDEAHQVAMQVQSQRPQPPMRPQWMDQSGSPPEPCKQKVIERFSHGCCIENPEGSHGIGIGTLLMPHQVAANITQNQFTDLATLSNEMGLGGFMHTNMKLDPGVKTVEPGVIMRVSGIPPADMEKAYFRLTAPQANPQLLQALQGQESAADGISSAPDVLSGQKDGDETFRGQATRVEQATKQLTVHASNFVQVLTNVGKNNALLNFMFMPDQMDMDVQDPNTQKAEKITVGRDMYKDSYDILFSADLSFSSRAAKIAEKDDALGMVTKGIPPQIAQLIFPPTMFSAMARECFKARGMYDLAAMVLSDEEIMAKVQAAQQPPGMPPGASPGPPGQPGQPPHPSVPTGHPTNTPGAQPPQTKLPIGMPTQAAPNTH